MTSYEGVTSGATVTSPTTSVSIAGATTSGTDRIVLAVCAHLIDATGFQGSTSWSSDDPDVANEALYAWANDDTDAGGGLSIGNGSLASAGSSGTFTSTIASSSTQTTCSLALVGTQLVELYDQTTNAGTDNVTVTAPIYGGGFYLLIFCESSGTIETPAGGWTKIFELDGSGSGCPVLTIFAADADTVSDDTPTLTLEAGGSIESGAGSASVTFTAAATSAATAESNGSASATFTAAGAGAAIAAASGSASATFAASATGASVAPGAGSASATFLASGAGASTFAASGSASASFSATGASAATAEAAGSSSAAFTASGVGAATFAATGAALATFTATGVAGSGEATGTASATFTAAGAGASTFSASGSATVTFASSGVGASTYAASGSASATFTATGEGLASGAGSGAASVTFAAAATGAATAAAVGAATMAAVASGVGAAIAAGTGEISFTFAAAGVSTQAVQLPPYSVETTPTRSKVSLTITWCRSTAVDRSTVATTASRSDATTEISYSRVDDMSYQIKVGDLEPTIRATLKDQDNAAVAFVGTETVTFRWRLKGSSTWTSGTGAFTSASAGTVYYRFTTGQTDTAGTYESEWKITNVSSQPRTFPSEGYEYFAINA